MMQSEQINELATALAKAQGAFEIPKKSRTARIRARPEKGGAEHSYNYADLADIREATVKALSINGLSVQQRLNSKDNVLTTVMMHASGQWTSTEYELPRGLAAQQFGSALTYARKYSYQNITGIVSDDDDDANRMQYESERKAKVNKAAPVIRPVVKQTQNGTSGLPLVEPPKAMGRQQILDDVKKAYLPYMKLFPNTDLSSELMARYGATNISKLTDAEAWDFLGFLNAVFTKGVSHDEYSSPETHTM